MTVVALVLCLLLAALGALGVVSPARFLSAVRFFETPAGLYGAAALRVALGGALLLAAPGSRAPGLLRVLGPVVVGLGLATPILGRRRGDAPRPLAGTGIRVRGWALLTLAIGLALAYAVAPGGGAGS